MECHEAEAMLGAVLDGELDPAISTPVRAHAETCTKCRQRLAEMQSIGRMVRQAPYYQASDRLRARVALAQTQSTRTSHLRAWAAAAVIVACVSGSILIVRSTTRAARMFDPADAVAQEVVSSHVRALMGEHLFDVRSTDQHTVKPWFLGKLDFSPPVTDLAQAGFPLTGGRLDYVAGHPVAALVYTRGQHTINVFVWPEGSDTIRSADARAIRGFHVRHWTRSGMAYWAVSDVNDADLDQFVHALQQ